MRTLLLFSQLAALLDPSLPSWIPLRSVSCLGPTVCTSLWGSCESISACLHQRDLSSISLATMAGEVVMGR